MSKVKILGVNKHLKVQLIFDQTSFSIPPIFIPINLAQDFSSLSKRLTHGHLRTSKFGD